MKKFIFVVAMLANMPAYADVSMPQDLIEVGKGTLCKTMPDGIPVTDNWATYYPDDTCKNDTIELKPFGFVTSTKIICYSTKVTIIGKIGQGITPVYDITFRCSYEPLQHKWIFRAGVFWARGFLTMNKGILK